MSCSGCITLDIAKYWPVCTMAVFGWQVIPRLVYQHVGAILYIHLSW
jgi:hypothetical protein